MDARYPAFNISQPDTFVDDALQAHINMDTACQQEEAEVVQYEGPVPIVDPLNCNADLQVCQQNQKISQPMGTSHCTTSKDRLLRQSLSALTFGTNNNAIPPSR